MERTKGWPSSAPRDWAKTLKELAEGGIPPEEGVTEQDPPMASLCYRSFSG